MNQKDSYEETPIFRAIRFRKESCVELLIKKGADLSVTDYKQQTPLHRACEMSTLPIITMLIDGSDIGKDRLTKDAIDSEGLTALEVLDTSKFTKKLYTQVEQIIQHKIDEAYCNKKMKLDNEVDIDPETENDDEEMVDVPIANIEVEIDPETENDDEEVVTDVDEKKYESFDRYCECLDGHLVPNADLCLIDDWLYTNNVIYTN
jgi:hypothetical protein